MASLRQHQLLPGELLHLVAPLEPPAEDPRDGPEAGAEAAAEVASMCPEAEWFLP